MKRLSNFGRHFPLLLPNVITSANLLIWTLMYLGVYSMLITFDINWVLWYVWVIELNFVFSLTAITMKDTLWLLVLWFLWLSAISFNCRLRKKTNMQQCAAVSTVSEEMRAPPQNILIGFLVPILARPTYNFDLKWLR